MKKLATLLAVAAVAAGCKDYGRTAPPPLDAIRFPVGIAVRHALRGCVPDAVTRCACTAGDDGCASLLYVANSNFDLTYDTVEGGALLSLDVPEPSARPPGLAEGATWEIPDLHPYLRGGTRVGSFAGEVALLDEETCPEWWSAHGATAPLAFVPSRTQNRLYRITLDASGLGSVDCADLPGAATDPSKGCRLSTAAGVQDPYSVAVACRGRAAAGTFDPKVYLTYLTTPRAVGFISRVDLTPDGSTLDPRWKALVDAGAPSSPVNVGISESRHVAFAAGTDRVYLTGRYVGPGLVPFRWLQLGLDPSGTNPPPPIDLAGLVWGSETTGFALSSDGRRAYVGLRLYDGFTSASLGVRMPDVGGAIAVLDLTEAPAGGPSGRLLQLVPVGIGPSEVKVLARPGLADLVAVSCNGDDSVWLYDDATGTVPRVFGRLPSTGKPALGKQPTGLAFEPRADGSARLYVGSFTGHAVSVVRIQRPADPRDAWIETRFGAGSP